MNTIIFDLFGTLVDIKNKSWPYKQAIISSSINPLTLKRRSREAQTLDISFNEFCSRINAKRSQELLSDLNQELSSIELFPDTLSTLVSLKQSGYTIGVCSNLAQPYQQGLTELTGLIDFSVLSFTAGFMKPEKSIYELAHKKANSPKSEILFIGDTLSADVKAPKKFGFQSVHLDRKSKHKTQNRIDSLIELPKYIDSLA